MSNWNWKVVRQFLKQSFDLGLSRSSCLNYLHRLGFVLKRPKKRLLKAKDEERKAFVLQYSQIREEAQESGAKIFFVDEAHFRADADLRGKWVLKGEAALVDSTSPRWGEKACYYSGVCLETGEVEAMEIAGNSNAETSTAFLQQLRANYPGPLVVIWDNGPAHRMETPSTRSESTICSDASAPERNWGSRMAGIPSFPNIVIISRFKVSPGEAVALPAASGTSTPSALRLCQNCRI